MTSKATQEPDTEHIVFTAKTTTVSSAQAQQVHQEEPEDVSITDTATEPVISNAAVTEPTTITTTDTLPKFTTISETSTTAESTEIPEAGITTEPTGTNETTVLEHAPRTTMASTKESSETNVTSSFETATEVYLPFRSTGSTIDSEISSLTPKGTFSSATVEPITTVVLTTAEMATECLICTKGFNSTLWDCGCYLIVLDHSAERRYMRSGSALPWHQADLNCADVGDNSHLLGEYLDLIEYSRSNRPTKYCEHQSLFKDKHFLK